MANKSKRNLLIILIALIVSTFWVIYTSTENKTSSNEVFSAPQKGFLAPDFELVDLNDNQHKLSDHRGKIVIVNVWASWCKPCQYEMPAMQNIYDKYSQDDLVLLAVNNTYQDNFNDMLTFVQSNSLTFPILLDREGVVSNLYQVQALPSTYFIDQKGIISDIVIGGPMSETLIESKILSMVENVSNP
ncbi:MAG TPA: TlpA disulfide reductase family protein [Anaerolineaceae bacterium]|nr:TlpA disulfide reductase family protein [Anaerolineaceae bacterium]